MAAAAILEIQVRAIKWAITTRFWCKLVYRLGKACRVRKLQKQRRWPSFKMTAILVIEMNAIKWAITIWLRWKTVHRLRQTFWAQKSPKRKWPTAFKMAAVAMLELLCYEMGNYHRTLMKIGTPTKQNMLIECKSHKSGSLRQKTAKVKGKTTVSF
jgi:hypothetical protein